MSAFNVFMKVTVSFAVQTEQIVGQGTAETHKVLISSEDNTKNYSTVQYVFPSVPGTFRMLCAAVTADQSMIFFDS